MSASIHLVRFLSQIDNDCFDVHVFNSHAGWGTCHGEMRNVTLHGCCAWPKPPAHSSVRLEGFWPFARGTRLAAFVGNRYCSWLRDNARKLAQVIDLLQPDIVHGHEMSMAGYLIVEAQQRIKTRMPPWIMTNWGHDIYYRSRLRAHQPRIRQVLSACNYYTCETQRDVGLARDHGFTGRILGPVMPNPGGFRFEEIEPLRTPGPPSRRRMVMLKGYQDAIGRAMTALRAFELCRDVLDGYKICIYSSGDDVTNASEALAFDTGLDIQTVPHLSYYELLRMRGEARVSVGLSMSDAASISFLEALIMGSFPIQSDRGSTHEWIEDGKGGFIVPPEDPKIVAAALRRALTDDALVDSAARINDSVARDRLDYYKLRNHVLSWYQTIARENNIPLPANYPNAA
jgi:hypothetical protein